MANGTPPASAPAPAKGRARAPPLRATPLPPAPPAPPAPPPQWTPAPRPSQGPPSTLAIVSVAAGALSILLWVTGSAFDAAGVELGPIAGVFLLALPITATVCGFLALREKPMVGRGLAIAGIVLGLTQLGLYAVALLFILVLMLACGRACGDSEASASSSGEGTWCGPCCEPCQVCGGGCGACGEGCGACGEGCSSCGEGCSSCGDGCSGCNCAVPPGVLLAAVPPARPPLRSRLDAATAHHPNLPRYRADAYRLLGVRFCVGCFTTYPVFLAASVLLALLPPPAAWPWLLAGGLGLAGLQAVSSLGWARWRWLKALVKFALGLGLATAVHGVLVAPLPDLAQAGLLAGMLGLALLSALPRRRRMLAVANQ